MPHITELMAWRDPVHPWVPPTIHILVAHTMGTPHSPVAWAVSLVQGVENTLLGVGGTPHPPLTLPVRAGGHRGNLVQGPADLLRQGLLRLDLLPLLYHPPVLEHYAGVSHSLYASLATIA